MSATGRDHEHMLLASIVSSNLKLVAIVFSLGLDTFAVAVALGISGIGKRNRLRMGASFALCEGGMPLVGFFAGRAVSGVLGDIASYVGLTALFAVGVYMLYETLCGDEETNFNIESWRGLMLTAVSVSLDELAIGFSMGALGLPIVLAVAMIAAQAFVLTFVGTALGNRIGERLASSAELIAGFLLSGLAIFLFAEKIR